MATDSEVGAAWPPAMLSWVASVLTCRRLERVMLARIVGERNTNTAKQRRCANDTCPANRCGPLKVPTTGKRAPQLKPQDFEARPGGPGLWRPGGAED